MYIFPTGENCSGIPKNEKTFPYKINEEISNKYLIISLREQKENISVGPVLIDGRVFFENCFVSEIDAKISIVDDILLHFR